jgi:23S rRNA (adenine-N6)-dimethyltransferase
MASTVRKEMVLAQNFLIRASLVRNLVGASTIGPADTVYDIGAGSGILAAELARAARKVIALEIDPALVRGLRERFRSQPHVQILEEDFLQYRIPDREYKVFANIPFNRTAAIVRKLLSAVPAPGDAYLVVQKEAAQKFSGCPRETRFSILVKPWFQIRILRGLRRTDFEPVPRADSVFLHIQRRDPPLVCGTEAGRLYREFIAYGFGGWKSSLKVTYRRVFSHRRWKRLAKELYFPLYATPTELSFAQWMGLFDDWIRKLPSTGRTAVRGRKPLYGRR